MNLTKEEKRNLVVNLIGYGNPEARLLLMGIEESAKGEWTQDASDEYFMKFKNGYTNEIKIEDLRKTTGTYNGYYRLIKKVFPEYKKDNGFFVANLLPFGKKDCKTKLTPEQCEMFGAKNHEELYEITINERHNALIAFFEKYNCKDKYIVFCIGNSNNKEVELVKFLSKLYNVNNEVLLNNIFKHDEKSKNLKPYTYLYKDNEIKKFITYQASSGQHINRAMNRIGELVIKKL